MNDPATPCQGLPLETQERLTEIITPGWRENPWPAKDQSRNQLVIRMLLDLALLPEELVYLYVDEVDCEDNELLAAASQPRMRVLWFSKDIGEMIRDYISQTRDSLSEAEEHSFLFVSTCDGKPISLSVVDEIFRPLRKVPGMPPDLSPQVLRQTWMNNLSEWCKKKRVPHQEEIELRKCVTGEGDRNAESFIWPRVLLRKPTILEILGGPEKDVFYVDFSPEP